MSGGYLPSVAMCNGKAFGTSGIDGTGVAPSASANTKGSWVQFTASSTVDIIWMALVAHWFDAAAAQQAFAVDVGIGGAGSEIVLVQNVMFPTMSQFGQPMLRVSFPISIPAGTAISLRSASNVASGDTPIMAMIVYDGAYMAEAPAGIDALGFVSATTAGAAVTSGNGSKGSYGQIIASTARDYAGIFAVVDNIGVSTPGTGTLLLDIAVGAAASEVIIVPDVLLSLYMNNPIMDYVSIEIPAGTRIAARIAADGLVFNVTVYGVYK